MRNSAQVINMTHSAPMEPRGTLNERRWGEVLQIASEVFGERGYPAASLQEIAERLGITKGSLYYYARTKEDLLFEILKRAHDYALTLIREDPLTQRMSPRQRLERFIRRWMDGLQRQQYTALSGGPGGSRDSRTDFLSDDRRSRIIGKRHELNRYLLDLIRNGMAQGEFNPQLDAQHVASWIFILMNDTRLWFRAKSMSWDYITNWYVTLVSRGLAPGSLDRESSLDPSS
jgi:AcrR family transcriptional regulator